MAENGVGSGDVVGGENDDVGLEDHETFLANHKKALKALDGEKRAALKKAKSLKGAKKNAAIASVEQDFASKLEKLESALREAERRREQQKKEQGGGGGASSSSSDPETGEQQQPENSSREDKEVDGEAEDQQKQQQPREGQLSERERKQEKARRKKQRQKEREAELERQRREETEAAGPSMREVELQQLRIQLDPLRLRVDEIPSDGNCLYRAVAAQWNILSRMQRQAKADDEDDGGGDDVEYDADSVPTTTMDYRQVRQLCASVLKSHPSEYEPFCELSPPDTSTYDDYVERVRSSNDWGGHLELRALAQGLNHDIAVYSASSSSSSPLILSGGTMTTTTTTTTTSEASSQHENGDIIIPPIRLSYHLHYYSLGEHYNQVVPKDE